MIAPTNEQADAFRNAVLKWMDAEAPPLVATNRARGLTADSGLIAALGHLIAAHAPDAVYRGNEACVAWFKSQTVKTKMAVADDIATHWLTERNSDVVRD